MARDNDSEELTSLSLSSDEISNRQRPGAPASGRRNGQPAEPSRPIGLWIIVILLLIALAFMAVQMQTLQSQTDKQLQALQVLQQKLTSTDEQANLSVDAMKILLKEQDHEIRKLWDLSNKRNRKNITKNTEKLDDQSKLLTKHSNQIGQFSKQIQSQKQSVATLSEEVKSYEDKISKSGENLRTDIAALEATMDKRFASLPKSVKKDIQSINKAIKAMDGTRLQHNKRISSLEKSIKSLESRLASQSSAASTQP